MVSNTASGANILYKSIFIIIRSILVLVSVTPPFSFWVAVYLLPLPLPPLFLLPPLFPAPLLPLPLPLLCNYISYYISGRASLSYKNIRRLLYRLRSIEARVEPGIRAFISRVYIPSRIRSL